jgi:hypothetical protein
MNMFVVLQSLERAMGVGVLPGQVKGCKIYAKKEDLMYWRAVIDGMDPIDSWRELNDPREFYGKLNFKYLGGEHLKGVSSKRGEISGKKGIRTLFSTVIGYNPDLAKTEEQVEEMKEKAAKVKGEVLSCFVCCLCKQTGSCGEASISSTKI